MLKQLSLLALAFSLIASPLVFAESQQEAVKKCKQWAQEENIPSDEMDTYMAECIKSLAE